MPVIVKVCIVLVANVVTVAILIIVIAPGAATLAAVPDATTSSSIAFNALILSAFILVVSN